MVNGTHPLRPALELLGDALWLRPAVGMGVGFAAGLGFASVDLDGLPRWLFSADAQAARDVLGTILSTTLTVTATVFGFIIVALQLASTQFSPRSLRSFVRDRGTQTSLALLLGVVAYTCGVLLRTSDGTGDASEVAMTVAIALVLVVAGTLAFLIHHTAQSIRVEHLMRTITEDTLAAVDALQLPTPRGRGSATMPQVPDDAGDIAARESGYIDEIDLERLVELAREHDVTICLRVMAGEHCIEHLSLAAVWRTGGRIEERERLHIEEGVAEAISVSVERTLVQDIAFGMRQLVDIALRAISPAINDPRTAVEATKNLSRILCALTDRPLEPVVCRDEDGTVRVALDRLGFDGYLGVACDQIRRFGAREPDVVDALLVLLGQVVRSRPPADRLDAVCHQLDLVEHDAAREIAQPADLEAVRRRARTVRSLVEERRAATSA
jgi:uncharacterized membrane protein